ncbi:MAG: ParB/RepB/Spo0J family partition protein [Hyphomicrobiales bacterium]|nr:ParB/RepB/Spo0J family partition protein [Hyphomicrobiales bacterium]
MMNIEPQELDYTTDEPSLDALTFAEAYALLESALKAAHGAPSRETLPTLPKALHHSRLKIVPALFQPRIEKEDRDHVAELHSALIESGKLDAVKVFPIGDDVYLIDGHHRVAAYREAEEARESDGMIPVSYLTSRILDDAIAYAAKENAKARKRLERWELSAWTWEIVKSETRLSKACIAKLTGTSEATIGRMRPIFRRIKEATATDPRSTIGWERWSWPSAMKWDKDHIPPTMDDDAETKALQRLYAKFSKAFGPLISKSPERIFRAIMQENQHAAERFILAARQDGFLETALENLGEEDDDENDDF